MKLYVAADHAGYELKEKIKDFLGQNGHELEDLGTHSKDSVDYPDFAQRLSEKVAADADALGVLICGSGQGMAMAANKIKSVRAACVSEPVSARLSREHNRANVLCLGARICGEELAKACVEAFLEAQFDDTHSRHQQRIKKINDLERASS